MRRPFLILFAATAWLGVLATGLPRDRVLAQDATPASIAQPPGVSFATLSLSPLVDVPSPAHLIIERVALNSGARYPFNAGTSSVGLILMEVGTLTIQAEGPVSLTRAARVREAEREGQSLESLSAAIEPLPAGQITRLRTGDAVLVPTSVVGQLRNEGARSAVAIVFVVMAPELTPNAATPTP